MVSDQAAVGDRVAVRERPVVGDQAAAGDRAAVRERAAYYLASGLWCSASVGWSLPMAAARWPDRVAITVATTSGTRRLTHRELLQRVQLVAADLVERGVRPGDRVLAQLPNTPELLVLVLAAWHVGAVAVPVVPMYRQAELSHIVRATRPSVVATAARRGDRHPAAELDGVLAELDQRPLVRYALGEPPPGWRPPPAPDPSDPSRSAPGGSAPAPPAPPSSSTSPPAPPSSSASRASAPGPAEPAPPASRAVTHRPPAPDECCLLLFTSGTTAEPKGVRHSSRSLLREARGYRDGALLGADSPVLVPAPVAHIGAVVAATLLPGLTGASTVLLAGWDPDLAVRVCAEERVALAIGAPVFLAEMLDRYAADDGRGHRISMFHTGAAPTGDSVVERAQRLGVTAWRAWGMTEAPTVTSGHPGAPLWRRTSTDGRVDVGCEVVAVDERRHRLPTGTPGELRIRGPKLMLGYLDPAHQAERTDADGWFYTGDIGVVDDEGWVTIRGRVKDIINRGGEKFAAAEIEAAIAGHPAIDAVAVVGLPDPRLGEQVGAFVTVRAGAVWPGAAALLAHLEAAQLARQKHPTVWQLCTELPRTPTGKILKRALAADWPHPRPVQP